MEPNNIEIEKEPEDETNENPDAPLLNHRSEFYLPNDKTNLSLYTRRVIETNKIKELLNENSTHGLCGGYNLGNTCFMNSSIACLSNCTELTYYFLCGDYKKDINTENNLGLNGKLAESWGELLKKYWIENTSSGDPSNFKEVISEKARRFRGYRQQDSNEFMNYFLDYMNEDLNAVTKKPYEEISEKLDNESDIDCSKRFWENNLKRNDSIIVDLFYGQLKSIVTCLECKWVSVTFDPFDSLNLPIPENSNKKKKYSYYDKVNDFQFFYVPRYNLRTPVKLVFDRLLKNTPFINCFKQIKNEEIFKYKNKIDINKIVINKIVERESVGFIDINTPVKELRGQWMFFYDLLNENENIKIPIYYIADDEKSEFPRIIFVSENTTFDEFRKKIYYNMRKLILSPFKKDNEEFDSLSEEIAKYIKDFNIEDDYIFDLIEKEYQQIFNDNNSNTNECLKNFVDDMPFKIYLLEKSEDDNEKKYPLLDKNNFFELSPEFKQLTNISSFRDPITFLINNLDKYFFVLEFLKDSKYINNKLFKLNTCTKNSFDYDDKYEEEEKKESEEDDGKVTLNKCFKEFCKEETLKKGNEWYCKKCKNLVSAKKKIELFYLPKILIICFNRFSKDSHCYYWEKNEEFIDFPINNLDMSEYVVGPDKDHSKYDLFAVSQHYGDTGGGHYTAVCKNFDEWYSYNDSSCHKTDPNNAVSESAYVLFYRRQTD